MWLTAEQVRALHRMSLAGFGGAEGVSSPDLLESALGNPRNLWAYGGAESLYRLAASYAFGIARNHPFVDGNKRAALLAIRAFLRRNGHQFDPPEAMAVVMMRDVASGNLGEVDLAEWIEASSSPRR